jgi:hypothetical protein
MTKTQYKWSREMELCISDCNGHPRSLEAVFKAFDSLPDIHLQTHSEIMTLANSLYEGGTSPVQHDLLKCALKGLPVNLTTTIDKKTMSSWLASGILINTNVKHTDFEIIPQISFFAMLLYTMKVNTTLSRVLADILSIGFGWNAFEQFHLKWELLMRLVYEETSINFSTLYHMPRLKDTPHFVAKEKRYINLVEPFLIGGNVSHCGVNYKYELGDHISWCSCDKRWAWC